jgi:hypothetical protein
VLGFDRGVLRDDAIDGGIEPLTDGSVLDVNAADVETVGLFVSEKNTFTLRFANAPGKPDRTFLVDAGARARPIAGAWNGAGDLVGTFDPDTGQIRLLAANEPDAAVREGRTNLTGDRMYPVAGRWQAGATIGVGVYDQATSTFRLWLALPTNGEAADFTFPFGDPDAGELPIAGDWDGDGDDTVALWFPGGAFFLRNENAPGGADVVVTVPPAGPSWRPVAGDFAGAGPTNVGLYNTVSKTFQLFPNNDPARPMTFTYETDIAVGWPIAGRWMR